MSSSEEDWIPKAKFQCKYCKKKYTNKCSLTRHVDENHNENRREHYYSICGSESLKHANVYIHLKIDIPGEMQQ